MIRIAILGSTGSVGRSTLRVVERHPDRFQVVALAAHRSVEALAEQVDRWNPRAVVVADRSALAQGCGPDTGAWRGGWESLVDIARLPDVDVVVNALVGAAGLEPTLAALEAGKRLALANKESLVAGGPLVLEAVERGGGELVPIDSEHSAILQCVEGADRAAVHRITLTASGGPFRSWSARDLREVRPSQALRHPTWKMGAKISIDSATLGNKALEVIEAHFLYGLGYDAIDVVVHPQSIVHSFVEFRDGSVLAQLGFPTMELPILYALTYPDRVPDPELRGFDPVDCSPLTFERPDRGAFPLLALGVEAGRSGGTAPAAFNAANEVAVGAFLAEKSHFLQIGEVVEETMSRIQVGPIEGIDDVMRADREARAIARERVRRSAAKGGMG